MSSFYRSSNPIHFFIWATTASLRSLSHFFLHSDPCNRCRVAIHGHRLSASGMAFTGGTKLLTSPLRADVPPVISFLHSSIYSKLRVFLFSFWPFALYFYSTSLTLLFNPAILDSVLSSSIFISLTLDFIWASEA
jgi:hypothetical protein